MKKTLIILFILLSTLCFSQQSKSLSFKKFPAESVLWNFDGKTQIADQDLQFEFIRYCQFHQFKERKTAYTLWGTGIAVGCLPLFVSSDKFKTPEKYSNFSKSTGLISAGFSLLALCVFIDSDKWMRYASFKPSQDGISIVIPILKPKVKTGIIEK